MTPSPLLSAAVDTECFAAGKPYTEPATMPARPPIRINLLRATVSRGAEVVQLAGRDMDLVYCIALRERPVPRPKLIADVWPDIGAQAATNSFNVCLHRLRNRLGRRDAICLTPYGYALGDRVTTDLRALDMFQKSLAVRSALSDHEIELVTAAHRRLRVTATPTQIAATETGDMFDRKVEYLKNRFAKQLAKLSLNSNHVATALKIAQEMIELDGCDESAWEIVIRAHIALHDRGAAIRDFRTYARNLAHELGLQPSRLMQQLMTQCADESSPAYALAERSNSGCTHMSLANASTPGRQTRRPQRENACG